MDRTSTTTESRMMPTKLKRGLVNAFAVFTAIAVVLNIRAAGVAVGRGWLSIAAGYVFIALVLAATLVVLWHVRTRQKPYRWRDDRSARAARNEPGAPPATSPSADSQIDWWREEFDVKPLDDDSWQPPWDDDAERRRE